MKLDMVAKALKTLGHPTRLSIYKEIVKKGKNGLVVGDIQEKLNIPNSTLSHHISTLCSAGLLSQQRNGRSLYCVVEFNALNDVMSYLHQECCIKE
ncbi:metalloregulator ArsR/SmtB family transcription factor [Vibrio sp. SS-MA-C1-2]|uniref:ArsR/SmtB family transcription factor n=1 Tax=Vibrio sp. SS-MA-C1-2 TaxID=2908646 RepID=UPI001F40302E|nr:metalloregulator ArsR/SmtB family transcription factor [Vibrio sp. SS-MA-C1-2]UJF18408.1 metalloregulator ArsR/SmtB family transcription factor [Vibrio sp. SS-MA-C1-2]